MAVSSLPDRSGVGAFAVLAPTSHRGCPAVSRELVRGIERSDGLVVVLDDELVGGRAGLSLVLGVADGSIPAEPPLEHAQQHRHVAIDVVEDPDLPLPGASTVKPAGVLDQRSPPRHGKRQEERIQPRVVEAFADVASGREDEALLTLWNPG